MKQPLIQAMITNASFELTKVPILVSSESDIITIALSLIEGEMFPISGFPRTLLASGVSISNQAYLAQGRQRKLTTLFGSAFHIR